MQRPRPRTIRAFWLSLAAAGPAAAADVTVVDSLADAVASAQDGDRIVVPGDTIDGAITVVDRDLTLVATAGAAWTATGGGPLLTVQGGRIRVEGFRVTRPGQPFVHAGDADVELVGIIGSTMGSSDLDGGAVRIVGGSLRVVDSTLSVAGAARGGWIFAEDSDVSIVRSTLDNGRATDRGGAIHMVRGALRLDDAVLTSNAAPQGGAVWTDSTAITVTGSRLESNAGFARGAGMCVTGGTLSITTTEIRRGTTSPSGRGGALYVDGADRIELSDSVVFGNEAKADGGAIFASNTAGEVVLRRTTLTGNRALAGEGGALRVRVCGRLVLDEVAFEANEAVEDGGAVLALRCPVTATDSTFTANRSTSRTGGGLAVVGEIGGIDAALTRVRFVRNEATAEGGGVALSRLARATLVDLDLVDNEARTLGGGLYARDLGALAVVRSDVVGNTARCGGAAYLRDLPGTATWSHGVLQHNRAISGGGLCVVDVADLHLDHHTWVGNAAAEVGGSLWRSGAGATRVSNSAIAHHRGPGAVTSADAAPGAIVVGWTSWFDNEADRGDGGDLGGGAVRADPRFATWSDDGEVNDSFVLGPDSPLIDAGDPTTVDRDGSRADLGAYGGLDASTIDADGDGYDRTTDCDDTDPDIHPGARDRPYDRINADCLPGSDFDQDGDGFATDGPPGDCDDTDPTIGPCDPDADTAAPPEPTEPPTAAPTPGASPAEASPTCGCASAPRGTSGALLALVAALAWRRRARRPR